MPYPVNFYYITTQSGRRHQRRASGKPDIARLVRGHADYWISPSLPKEKKKKKLILADWSASNWSRDKIHAIRTALARLIDHDFKVYLWQTGQLKALMKEELASLDDAGVRAAMMPGTLEEINLAAAAQHHLARDETLTLDDYWVNQLVNKDSELKPRSLSLYDLSVLSTTKQDTVLNLLQQSTPAIDYISLDVFSEQAKNTIRKLQDLLPVVRNRPAPWRYVQLEQQDIEAFLESTTITKGDLTLNGTITTQALSLKNSEITSKALLSLLMNTAQEHLKSLDLSGCHYITENMQFVKGSLPHLEALYSSYNKLSAASLQSLLAAISPGGLKILDLTSSKSLADANKFTPENLLLLEELNLTSSNITAAGLQAWLTACTQGRLKKLDLSGCQALDGTIELAPGSLPLLEEISLTRSNITAAGLQSLLTACTQGQLKKLDLFYCKFLDGTIELAPDSLPLLEEINLSQSNITAAGFQSLLIACTQGQLKKLNLFYCQALDGTIELAPGSLPLLEKITLDGCNVSPASLESLFAAAPKLDKDAVMRQLSPRQISALMDYRTSASGSSPFDAESWYKPEQISSRVGSHQGLPPITSDPGADSTSPPQTTPACTPFTGMPLDADTRRAPEKAFHLKRIFYPMGHANDAPVNHYRMDVYQTTKINPTQCAPGQAFSCQKTGDLGLIARTITCAPGTQTIATKPDSQLFYGKQSLSLTTDWQALASISPEEEILRYHVSPETHVEIRYSTRDSLYYVRSNKSQSVDIDFTVQVPAKKPDLPANIQALVTHFQNFGAGELVLEGIKEPTGNDYLQAMLSQQKGACRHRAFAFKVLMAREHPEIPTRIITNDCHAFAEVKLNGQWVCCDLGGYAARLEIDESAKPDKLPHESPIKHTVLHTPAAIPCALPPAHPINFEQALRTWERKPSLTHTALEYYQHSISSHAENRLIECQTAEDADDLHYGLLAYCQHTSRPVFYVNSPDDLICSAPYLHRHENDTGELRHGPGGPLHEFLKNHPNGVLLINYSNFKADDLVRFNALLDTERKADGTDVPPDTLIIGLLGLDKLEEAPGSDFYSRFNHTETCPLAPDQLVGARPALPAVAPSDTKENPRAINLYHAPDWEERLLGRWVPHQGTWYHEEGALQQAIRRGTKAITLQNGLWDNPAFCRFWREALQSGVIERAGQRLVLPAGLRILRDEGHDWATLNGVFQQEKNAPDAPCVVLNPALIAEFFGRYKVGADKTLQPEDGFIQKAQEGNLHVHVTRALGDDAWAMLLQACQDQGVTLRAYCAPGVVLPDALQQKTPANPQEAPSPWQLTDNHTQVVQSTDVDTTVALMVQQQPDILVIDVSECDDSDLLSKTQGALINRKGEPLRIEFTHTQCAVARALEKGQSVILKGHVSTALADELAPLLLQRRLNASPIGRLMIVSENTQAFNYLPTEVHDVSIDEKCALLQSRLNEIPEALTPYLEESLSTLTTRGRFLKAHPDEPSDNAWRGLKSLPDSAKDPGDFSSISAEQAATFARARKDQVNAVLARAPYVFLTGLSGVGKTTFVTESLCQSTDTLYQGEAACLAWATSRQPGRKLLFLDEANLSPSDWSAFEGLFNQPPGILIEGEYYPLTDQHRVIFAGNPVNYGDERKLAPFFKRHGNAVVFEPLPSSLLYEHSLKPIFKGTTLEAQTAHISRHLLAVYRCLCLQSGKDLLISPRELQMMALLTVSHANDNPTADGVELARYFAWRLASPLVPADMRDEFDRQFKEDTTLLPNARPAADAFLITPSRQHVSQLLDEFLSLHALRRQPDLNDVQRYGGLGGMILDGEPGIGKSELVIHALLARGYQEVHDLHQPASVEKPFYRLPVSMPLADKETLLRKAFHEGAVVVIDEINSSAMMERLLNALLMGTTPEGVRPKKPGFMVIGTQNPITMAGRRAPSTALSRRLTTVQLPPYNAEEMHNILRTKNLPEPEATALVKAFETQVAFAKQHHLSPAPTFRDLMAVAKQVLKARCAARDPDMPQHSATSDSKHRFFAAKSDREFQRIAASDKLANKIP